MNLILSVANSNTRPWDSWILASCLIAWEPNVPASTCFICSGRWVWPLSHSNWFPSNENLVGPITVVWTERFQSSVCRSGQQKPKSHARRFVKVGNPAIAENQSWIRTMTSGRRVSLGSFGFKSLGGRKSTNVKWSKTCEILVFLFSQERKKRLQLQQLSFSLTNPHFKYLERWCT